MKWSKYRGGTSYVGNCEVKVMHYKIGCWYNAYGELLLNYTPVKPQQIGS